MKKTLFLLPILVFGLAACGGSAASSVAPASSVTPASSVAPASSVVPSSEPAPVLPTKIEIDDIQTQKDVKTYINVVYTPASAPAEVVFTGEPALPFEITTKATSEGYWYYFTADAAYDGVITAKVKDAPTVTTTFNLKVKDFVPETWCVVGDGDIGWTPATNDRLVYVEGTGYVSGVFTFADSDVGKAWRIVDGKWDSQSYGWLELADYPEGAFSEHENDNNIKVEKAGSYYAVVDTEEKTLDVIEVTEPTTKVLSLIGTLKGSIWDTDYDMTYSKGYYRYTVDLKENDEFKIRADHDWPVNYGFDKVVSIPENAFADASGNIKCTRNGTYTVNFNAEAKYIWIKEEIVEKHTFMIILKGEGLQEGVTPAVPGGHNGWDEKNSAMTWNQEEGCWYFELGEIDIMSIASNEFKIAALGSWTGAMGAEGGGNFQVTYPSYDAFILIEGSLATLGTTDCTGTLTVEAMDK